MIKKKIFYFSVCIMGKDIFNLDSFIKHKWNIVSFGLTHRVRK